MEPPQFFLSGQDLTSVDLCSLRLTVAASGLLECYCLTFIESLESVRLDLREVHEEVVSTLALDEAITLFRVEPLYRTFCHANPSFHPYWGKNSATPDVTYCEIPKPRSS